MIRRVVRMSFYPEKVKDFLDCFNKHKDRIRQFEGCMHLELWRDTQRSNVFYTYSLWQDEISIENYRNSELFNEVWIYTKQLFNERPIAFSGIKNNEQTEIK